MSKSTTTKKSATPSAQSMKKLKEYLINWSEGYDVKTGKKFNRGKYTPSEIRACMEFYNEINRGNKPSFVRSGINEILNKCGIKTIKEGIGWRVK